MNTIISTKQQHDKDSNMFDLITEETEPSVIPAPSVSETLHKSQLELASPGSSSWSSVENGFSRRRMLKGTAMFTAGLALLEFTEEAEAGILGPITIEVAGNLLSDWFRSLIRARDVPSSKFMRLERIRNPEPSINDFHNTKASHFVETNPRVKFQRTIVTQFGRFGIGVDEFTTVIDTSPIEQFSALAGIQAGNFPRILPKTFRAPITNRNELQWAHHISALNNLFLPGAFRYNYYHDFIAPDTGKYYRGLHLTAKNDLQVVDRTGRPKENIKKGQDFHVYSKPLPIPAPPVPYYAA